jgi:aspartate ammonia-lyase
MPGKVNPAIPEMVDMVAFQVLGHDATIAMACQAGQLELNVMMPVVAYNLLQSMQILTAASHALATRCVGGMTVNAAQCRSYAQRSLALVTALAPRIGYAKAATIAKRSLASGRPIMDVVVKEGVLSTREAQRLLDPKRLALLSR